MKKILLFFILLFSAASAFSDENELQRLVRLQDEFIGSEIFCHSPETETELELFKHCYLRFVHTDYSNDIAINFQVHPKAGVLAADAIPLIFGSYQMTMYVQNFSEIWNQYYFSGEVKSYRSILSLSKNQIKAVINEVNLWSQDISKIGHYTLFKNNCVGALIKLFKNSNVLDSSTPHEYHPGQFPKWLIQNGLTNFPIKVLKPANIRAQLEKILSLTGPSVHDVNLWPENSYELLEENFFIDSSPLVRRQMFQTLLYSGFDMPLELRRELSKNYKSRRRNSYKKLTQLLPFDQEFYYSYAPAQLLMQNLSRWNLKELHELNKYSQARNNANADLLEIYSSQVINSNSRNFGKIKKVKLKIRSNSVQIQICRQNASCRDEKLLIPIKRINSKIIFMGKTCELDSRSKNLGNNCSIEIIKKNNKQKIIFVHTKGDLHEIN